MCPNNRRNGDRKAAGMPICEIVGDTLERMLDNF
jgi:hypothetical protein